MAEKCSVDGVVQFLESIHRSKYIETFRNEDIDGSILYEILFGPGSDASNTLRGWLGLSDPIDVARIKTKFRKYLRDNFST